MIVVLVISLLNFYFFTILFLIFQFHNSDDAKKALEQLNGFELAGRPMKVNHVTERSETQQGTSLLDSDEMERAGIDLGKLPLRHLHMYMANEFYFYIYVHYQESSKVIRYFHTYFRCYWTATADGQVG